ncbi:MAG TPA: DNA-directed RNA polymerase subunit D [Candidatus Norongarragalinales archaeon]|jgi:DNA-directed RNA polymerase subunit D|nr:DNA-directed RNA polymerase subunit D [Candidatus Norongarragalinales archaeon]
MKIEVLNETNKRVDMHIKEASITLVNALRRAITSDMSSFAVSDVTFFENNSPMFNEYLAHRVGLVPLTFDPAAADDLQVTFSLNKQGPGIVLSGDMQSSDEKIRVFNDKVPIMKLAEGQKLRFEGVAVKGTAKKHARWQAALASYSYYPEVKINKKAVKKPEELVKAAQGMLTKDLESKGIEKSDLAFLLQEMEPEGVKVTMKNDEFLFFVESYNNIPAMKHFQTAVKMLEEKVKKIEDEL